MSAIDYVQQVVIPAAYKTLALAGAPSHMESIGANAMLLAIGLQESRFQYRRQINGPARGFWMPELTGGYGLLLKHWATRDIAREIGERMAYAPWNAADFPALEHNDILCCVGGRLLLYTHPRPLPDADDPEEGWQQYMDCWRPGKPHRETWDAFYREAWERVVA